MRQHKAFTLIELMMARLHMSARPVSGGTRERDADCQWFTIDQKGVMAAGPGDACRGE